VTDPPKAEDLIAAVQDLAERLAEVSRSLSRLLELTLNLSTGMASDTVQHAFSRLDTLDKQMATVEEHQATEHERIDALEQHPPGHEDAGRIPGAA
jgi:hypothetical protein